MQRRIVAIHQPNFFPWLGYFNKIARADVFCFMDNVQFPKKGGTWINRVKMNVNGSAAWITVPVDRGYSGVREVREMKINNATPWRVKLLRTLQTNYGRCAHFDQILPDIKKMIANDTDDLAEYNQTTVRKICEKLNLETEFVAGSTLDAAGSATELIINMVRAVGGTAYFCGGGSGGYLEEDKFSVANIELIYQSFEHPEYRQPTNGFVAGLSIVDAMMNCGLAETERLVKA